MSLLQNSNAISTSGYPINNSLRFQSASSQYLSRTTGSVTNNKILTLSAWVKRGTLGVAHNIFSAGLIINGVSADVDYLQFTSSNTLQYTHFNGSVYDVSLITTQVFRDQSAWYHILIAIDTTQATASNRVKLYVNGSQVTAFTTATYPALNGIITSNKASTVTRFGSSVPDAFAGAAWGYFDGYMAEVNFIDGQALTPSSFGETNTLTGQWIAKKYTGTYGTNGFYLPFSNGTSTTTLGYDSSGNGNNWTLTNFTRSAGVSDCWMYDVPSGNGSAGTQPNSNYAVMNPIGSATSNIFIRANLSSNATAANTVAKGSVFANTGKWYCEFTVTAQSGAHIVGVVTPATTIAVGQYVGATADGYGYASSALKYNSASGVAYGTTWALNDVIGIALDLDAGTLTFYKNNVSQGVAYTGISGEYTFAYSGGASSSVAVNFGQRSFAYTPPSGFKALCTANLPASTIVKGNQYMDATLYTGNGTSQSIVNAGGFSPDFVWLKSRSSGAQWHILEDTVRGAGTVLFSNSTAADQSYPTSITSFNSNGFSVGSDSTGGWNVSGSTMVAWQWDAGSSTVTNTSGTISSQVRANTTAGFSIVTYTGTGVNGATFGHGLGVAPSFIIIKTRTGSSTNFWICYHKSLGATSGIYLNRTDAVQTFSDIWNNTAPTSSVVTLGTTANDNANGNTYVAYCWAEIAGFSKFGSYTGNGNADGPFVYCGFQPKYVLIKRTDSTGYWNVLDTSRSSYNVAKARLSPNASDAEDASISTLDFLSNGFKLRDSSIGWNASGGTYIYMAFAENPFQNSNAR